MPSCRSPPFLSSNKILKRKGGRKMNKEYFLFVNGKKIKVSEEIYKVYWQEKNHENYLKQIDQKIICFYFLLLTMMDILRIV